MHHASYIFALIGSLFLLAAGALWSNIGQPELEPAIGRIGQHTRRANWAAIATVAAFSFCVMAAVLAIIEWMF
jgi:hypothetical protein